MPLKRLKQSAGKTGTVRYRLLAENNIDLNSLLKLTFTWYNVGRKSICRFK